MHPLSLRQLPRWGSRDFAITSKGVLRENLLPSSGGSATARWQRGCISGGEATEISAASRLNAPPQSPSAPAPPEGEPRRLLASAPTVGSRGSRCHPGESRDYGFCPRKKTSFEVFLCIAYEADPIRRCTVRLRRLSTSLPCRLRRSWCRCRRGIRSFRGSGCRPVPCPARYR